MIKNILKIILILSLTLFSFYYTDKSIELIRCNDPIMKEIKSKSTKFNVDAIDAKIIDKTIIPGKTGQEIDYEKTYNKMKQYGAYNEVLTVMKEVKPEISIDNNYDKYIIHGNEEKKSVALIFKVEEQSPNEIVKILKEEKVNATFFISSNYIENNYEEVASMTKFQLELLNNNYINDELNFLANKEYLQAITNKDLKFCYTENQDENILNICKKQKMHTIIPTIIINNKLYEEIKDNLVNSAIISIPISSSVTKELKIIINYIRTRGYKFESLSSLLSENVDN